MFAWSQAVHMELFIGDVSFSSLGAELHGYISRDGPPMSLYTY